MNGKIRWGVIGSGGIARRRTIPEGITQARQQAGGQPVKPPPFNTCNFLAQRRVRRVRL